MSELIIIGDTHFKINEPFFSAGKSFMKWFSKQKFNNENNYLIHLGDVYHESKPNPQTIKEVENWFLNELKFKQIFILAGNHGYNRAKNSYAIEPLINFGNIKIFKEPQIFNIENLKLLVLPYYYPHTNNLLPMEKYYSNLPKKFSNPDFIFGHIEDEYNHFNENYCDLSQFKKDIRIFGHIHIPKDHYLGSAFISRFDEKGKDNFLKVISIKTKDIKKISIPRFLDYYNVDYPNQLPDVEALYSIWNVYNASNKENVLENYSNIYIHEIIKKQTQKKVKKDNISSSKKSIVEHFKEFCQLNNSIDNKLQNRLLELIQY